MKARMRISLSSASRAMKRAQAFYVHFEKLARLGDAAQHQAALPGNHADFAGEMRRARASLSAAPRQVAGWTISILPESKTKNGTASCRRDGITVSPALNRSKRAGGAKTFDLCRGQDRKCLRAGIEGADRGQGRHGFPSEMELSIIDDLPGHRGAKLTHFSAQTSPPAGCHG